MVYHDDTTNQTSHISMASRRQRYDYVPATLAADEEQESLPDNPFHVSSKRHPPQASPPPSLITPAVLCILVTEAAERFAYFGFRAILVLYFTWQLQYTEETAIALFAYVTCLAYLSPLLGATLADGPWGRFHTIWRFGAVYVMGLAILSAAAWQGTPTTTEAPAEASTATETISLETQRVLALGGLVLVCLGTGGIKPCVSAFGADQVSLRFQQQPVHDQPDHDGDGRTSSEGMLETENKQATLVSTLDNESPQIRSPAAPPNENAAEHAVRQFFSYFYFCINVGALLSFVVVPWTRQKAGFGPAFSLSLCFMAVALTIFLCKRHEYIHHVPHRTNGHGSSDSSAASSLSANFVLCWWLIRHSWWQYAWFRTMFPCWQPRDTISHVPEGHGPENESDRDDGDIYRKNSDMLHQQLSDAAQAVHVLPILCMFPVFWCLYDQQSSVWTLQATKMRLDWYLTPENMNAVNPLQIMVFIHLFSQVLYPKLESWGWDISPLRRIGWGMIFAAASFSVSGILETVIEQSNEGSISVLWQLPQITLLSVSEIFVSVTGLEFAYATSPHRLKAFLMALFLLTTAVGDLLSGILYSTAFVGVDRALVMHICALLMLGNRVVFFFVARWWQARDARTLVQQATMRLPTGNVASTVGPSSATVQSIELEERRIV